MDIQIARNLATALATLEKARHELVAAPDETVIECAAVYERARADAGPAFQAAQRAYEEELAAAGESPPATDPVPGEGPGPDAPAPEMEASPGVALIQPPGVVVDSENLDGFGALTHYRSKSDGEQPTVEATPYAFAEGTAIQTPNGNVATVQPTRVIRGSEGELGVVPNDVFNETYEKADPSRAQEDASKFADTPEGAPVEEPAPAAPAETSEGGDA